MDLVPKDIDGTEYLVCTVSDEGLGLTELEKAKVFDKFFRTKASVLKIPDGTGLGMYLLKNVVEAHGGTVWVESEGKDKGTSVSLALPMK